MKPKDFYTFVKVKGYLLYDCITSASKNRRTAIACNKSNKFFQALKMLKKREHLLSMVQRDDIHQLTNINKSIRFYVCFKTYQILFFNY